jgi:mRNA-degrading endonuclease toxin of MazEF toxin-antitoxin module
MRISGERSGGPTFPSPAVPISCRRPVLVVQADSLNRSRIQTVTSNTAGNVVLSAGSTGLPATRSSNVSQLLTLDGGFLTEQIGALPPRLQGSVDAGLRTVLQL